MKLELIDVVASDAKKSSTEVPQNINTNITYREIRQDSGRLFVDFDYVAAYAPDGSYIRLGGRAVFAGPEVKGAHDEWSKSQRISGEAGQYIVNAIHYSASINAVLVARALNMTPPLILPTLTLEAPAAGGAKAAKEKKK